MSVSSGSSVTGMSSATPVDVDPDDEETTKYESLYEMRQSVGHHHVERTSCCSSSVVDDDDDDHGHDNAPLQSLPCQGAASFEDDFPAYLQDDETSDHQEQRLEEPDVEQRPSPTETGRQKEESQATQSEQPLTDLETLPDLPLELGDHVYQWRSFAGLPGVFQHHGIVMDIGRDEDGEMELSIADFSCLLRAPSNVTATKEKSKQTSGDNATIRPAQSIDMLTGNNDNKMPFSLHPHGILRVYNSSTKDPKWHKVVYRASVWKTSLWRSGTCTTTASDPPAKVLARAYFLLENPHVLPSYHVFRSNCECVSLWCKTGSWSTLQASSLLSLTAAGQLKSTASIAAYAASQTTTVTTPAAGLWGYLGYTTSTQVSLLSAQPHLVPILAAYGVVTVGCPAIVLWQAQRFWEKTTERLNEEFWKHACKDPDFFAESLYHWSERHRAFER